MRQGGPKRWFEDSDDEDNENKWEYMEHHGVMFPEPYFAKGLSITYGGVRIKYPRDYVVCKKYEKARRLKRCIDQIRKDYMRKIEEGDIRSKQLGTATYLIDKLALRVGNEKGEDEADTVGCCSLRVEHIEIIEDNQITLDFLGKDSMRYVNTIQVPEPLWKNLKLFRNGKAKDDNLFDKIDTQILNDYLKSQMEGLTAKVFRTYNASETLQQQLKKFDLRGLSLEEKVEKYL